MHMQTYSCDWKGFTQFCSMDRFESPWLRFIYYCRLKLMENVASGLRVNSKVKAMLTLYRTRMATRWSETADVSGDFNVLAESRVLDGGILTSAVEHIMHLCKKCLDPASVSTPASPMQHYIRTKVILFPPEIDFVTPKSKNNRLAQICCADALQRAGCEICCGGSVKRKCPSA